MNWRKWRQTRTSRWSVGSLKSAEQAMRTIVVMERQMKATEKLPDKVCAERDELKKSRDELESLYNKNMARYSTEAAHAKNAQTAAERERDKLKDEAGRRKVGLGDFERLLIKHEVIHADAINDAEAWDGGIMRESVLSAYEDLFMGNKEDGR